MNILRRIVLLVMPILLLACFFVLGGTARAAGEPAHLWHFDECEGDILKDSVGAEDLPQNPTRIAGKWQCAISQPWQEQYYIEKIFSAPLATGELTLSLYWRNSAFPNEGRNHIYLKKADGNIAAGIRPSIYSRTLYYDGGATTLIPAMPSDSNWHLITITYGPSSLIYYVDGEPKAVFNGDYAIKDPITNLEIKGENWPVEMDELAIWHRALSGAEVAEIYTANKPLEPYIAPVQPDKARLSHLWHFDQGAGTVAADSVGATPLKPIVKWTEGRFGQAIEHSWQNGYEINENLSQAIENKDLSLDFWWQNSAYPNEGRVSLELQNSAGAKIFGIRPSIYSGSYYFNGAESATGNIFPNDNLWHHLALVYDSYNFYLAFYIDGVEKIRLPQIWFRRPITKLVIRGENWFYKIDELAVWQGALNPAEVKSYYDSGKPHNIELESVILVPGIMGSWKVSGKWELDPILHTYDNLWQALKNAGYEEDKNLFALPYQWRLSNGYTAESLKQKIQEVKAISGRDKVDIIAHSMGGLIARSYIQGTDYQNDIDQLIFLGVPHRGSTKAYLMWEGGEFGIKRNDLIMQRILTVEADFNGYGSLFSYIRNLPMQSVQELLPTYDYLRDKNTMALRIYPNNYPANIFLELLNNPFELQKLSSVRMVNILADASASSTIENLRVINKEFNNGQWLNGYPENYSLPFTDHGLEYGSGDTTVPSRSSKDFAGLENIIINSDHASIATDAQKKIIKELTGVEPAQEVRLSLFKKFFLVRIFSPADFVITAPDGKRLGKNFLNNQTVNEIAGAFYSGFDTDAEFAVIPDPMDGEYKVELQGTGQGEYELSASLIDDNQQIDKEFSGNIASAEQRDFNITYFSAASENPISELEPVDITPPVITINKPIENDQYLHSDNLVIDYAATDDFSGIATTSVMIDGQTIATTTVDLFDYSLGAHSLSILAIDKAGNQAQVQVNFEIIANIESATSDIQEIYERGWLTDKIYAKLLKGAFKLLKIEIKYFSKERELNEKLIRKIQDDSRITDEKKQKLVERYSRKLAELKISRQKVINISLDLIIKLLNRAKDKSLLNKQGYDIILGDVNYLRNNL